MYHVCIINELSASSLKKVYTLFYVYSLADLVLFEGGAVEQAPDLGQVKDLVPDCNPYSVVGVPRGREHTVGEVLQGEVRLAGHMDPGHVACKVKEELDWGGSALSPAPPRAA